MTRKCKKLLTLFVAFSILVFFFLFNYKEKPNTEAVNQASLHNKKKVDWKKLAAVLKEIRLSEKNEPANNFFTKEENEVLNKLGTIFWTNFPLLIDKKLENEGKDEEWTKRAEAEIEDIISKPENYTTELVNIHCGKTVCKALLHHLNKEKGIAFFRENAGEKPWQEGNFSGPINTMQDGYTTYVYFFPGNDNSAFAEVEKEILDIQKRMFPEMNDYF